tara:strand:+ start:20266 stop:21240 length:975 start_codon:yes stop_codon:yes gene_type:complete
MKKRLIIIVLLFGNFLYSQITLIPDPVFEDALVVLGIDSDGIINGQVLTSDIDGIINFDFPGNPLITDLTGIEDFASLEDLHILSVNITEINLSQNLNLKQLSISDVSLNNLDLSNNLMLESLLISLNNSGGFFSSPITQIDVSFNSLLYSITINGSLITDLDFSNNTNINSLRIWGMNELTSLNLNNNNNTGIGFLHIDEQNNNIVCLQVDDPVSVIEGIDPPYDNWIIEVNPIISDNCFLGIDDNLQTQINTYPNPVKDNLYINTPNNMVINKISVYNVLGKKVIETYGNQRQINLSRIAKGLLLVKIETNHGLVVKKIIKE